MLAVMSRSAFCSDRTAGVMLCAALLLAAAPVAASITEAFDLPTLVARADDAVVVTAVRSESRWDSRGRIVTDITLRIEDSMKGGAVTGDEVVMVVFGGSIGDLGMTIAGEPHMALGDRAVVFATRSSQGWLRPVGMAQGVLPIVERDGRSFVEPGGVGLSLVQRGHDGVLRAAPGALLEARALSLLLDEVRTLATEARP